MAVDDFAAQLARERALKQAEKMETIGRLTGAIAQQFHELLSVILARSATLAKSLPPNRDLDELNATASVALRARMTRSEEHTSELQSRSDLVCRLLLEKKKNTARDLYYY